MSTDGTTGAWTIGDDLAATEFDADELLLVNPSGNTIEAIIATGFDHSPPRIRVLAEESVMKPARNNFALAAKAADLVDDDRLAIRTAEVLPRNSPFSAPIGR